MYTRIRLTDVTTVMTSAAQGILETTVTVHKEYADEGDELEFPLWGIVVLAVASALIAAVSIHLLRLIAQHCSKPNRDSHAKRAGSYTEKPRANPADQLGTQGNGIGDNTDSGITNPVFKLEGNPHVITLNGTSKPENDITDDRYLSVDGYTANNEGNPYDSLLDAGADVTGDNGYVRATDSTAATTDTVNTVDTVVTKQGRTESASSADSGTVEISMKL